MNLLDFINEVLDSESYYAELEIYTTSSHSKFMLETINEIVKENPEYYYIAKYFCCYPIQEWSRQKRNDINIDLSSLENMKETNGIYAGIIVHDQMDLQSLSLKLTDEILASFNTIFSQLKSKHDIEIIDDFLGKSECSRYLIKKYLKPLLIKIFSNNYLKFNDYHSTINDMQNQIDDEIYIAYHDMEYLISVVRTLKFNNVKTDNVDSLTASHTIWKLIYSLNSNPYTKDCFKIIKLSYENCGINEIAKILDKPRSYVKDRYFKGLKALEIVLWGYSLENF